jgi:hypothetical protein
LGDLITDIGTKLVFLISKFYTACNKISDEHFFAIFFSAFLPLLIVFDRSGMGEIAT